MKKKAVAAGRRKIPAKAAVKVKGNGLAPLVAMGGRFGGGRRQQGCKTQVLSEKLEAIAAVELDVDLLERMARGVSMRAPHDLRDRSPRPERRPNELSCRVHCPRG